MADPADFVRDNAAALAGYRDWLEAIVTEQSVSSGASVGMAPLPPDAPFPGNSEAFGVLMVIWEKVPRLEASLLKEVAGHPGPRRGGSAGNFLDALGAIPGLAAGLDEDGEAAAGRILDRLVRLAQSVRDIDEAERWRYVRGHPCPRCGCFFLRVLEDARGQPAGRVECFGHTETGPCRAAWGRLLDLASDLDGFIETAPGMAG